MKKIERLREIENASQNGRFVTIAEIAEKLEVSESTIRRDLHSLAEKNLVTVSGGGFVWNEQMPVYFAKIHEKVIKNVDIKQKVASYAATTLSYRDCIYMESGETMRELAKQLPEDLMLTVVTPDLMTALTLSSKVNISTIVLGGCLLAGGHLLVGDYAISNIERMRFTKVFLSPHSITKEGDLLFNNVFATTLRRLAMERAEKIIVLANHAKFGLAGVFSEGKLDDVDMLISDCIPDDFLDVVTHSTNLCLIPNEF